VRPPSEDLACGAMTAVGWGSGDNSRAPFLYPSEKLTHERRHAFHQWRPAARDQVPQVRQRMVASDTHEANSRRPDQAQAGLPKMLLDVLDLRDQRSGNTQSHYTHARH
jgi:hypothetical protein